VLIQGVRVKTGLLLSELGWFWEPIAPDWKQKESPAQITTLNAD